MREKIILLLFASLTFIFLNSFTVSIPSFIQGHYGYQAWCHHFSLAMCIGNPSYARASAQIAQNTSNPIDIGVTLSEGMASAGAFGYTCMSLIGTDSFYNISLYPMVLWSSFYTGGTHAVAACGYDQNTDCIYANCPDLGPVTFWTPSQAPGLVFTN